MLRERSADTQDHVEPARDATDFVESTERALLDGVGVVSVFSAVVGDNFDGKEIIATMVTTANGRMNITYRDHEDGFEI